MPFSSQFLEDEIKNSFRKKITQVFVQERKERKKNFSDFCTWCNSNPCPSYYSLAVPVFFCSLDKQAAWNNGAIESERFSLMYACWKIIFEWLFQCRWRKEILEAWQTACVRRERRRSKGNSQAFIFFLSSILALSRVCAQWELDIRSDNKPKPYRVHAIDVLD